MASTRVITPPKTSTETVAVVFDFTSLLAEGETLDQVTCTAAVYSGTDASPDIFDGSPDAGDSIVTQLVKDGVEGVIYRVTCTATTELASAAYQTLVLSTYIAIIPQLP